MDPGLSVEQRDHVTLIRWTGPFDLEGAKQVIHALWAHGQFLNPYSLLDLRQAENALRPADLNLASDFMRRFMHQRRYGRIAYLVQPQHLELARWFAKSLREAPYEVRAFTDADQALEWLEAML